MIRSRMAGIQCDMSIRMTAPMDPVFSRDGMEAHGGRLGHWEGQAAFKTLRQYRKAILNAQPRNKPTTIRLKTDSGFLVGEAFLVKMVEDKKEIEFQGTGELTLVEQRHDRRL